MSRWRRPCDVGGPEVPSMNSSVEYMDGGEVDMGVCGGKAWRAHGQVEDGHWRSCVSGGGRCFASTLLLWAAIEISLPALARTQHMPRG